MAPYKEDASSSTLGGRFENANNPHLNHDFDVNDSQIDESQTQTQVESTQHTQLGHLTPDESSNLLSASSPTPLSPPAILPWGRLVPCVPSTTLVTLDLIPAQNEYWIGRSSKCDVTAVVPDSTTLGKKERISMEWGKSMVSNRHCRIFSQQTQYGTTQVYVEDNSGNGTFINQQTHLRKGENRILHSGDEICLVNVETLRKRISSHRILQLVLQQFSFIFVQSKPRKSCVNPRAMNYSFAAKQLIGGTDAVPRGSPRSSRRIETVYDIREVLGDGTSGQVRRAIHRQTGEEYAVKIISLRRHLDMTMMEREVSLLQSLDHPYIVQLIDVFVHHGVAMYLVMELVKGGDLFDRIVEKQRYTEVEARWAMRRLLSAVYYLHEQKNIVHRDLKPENILWSSPTQLKLADFGLAKIVKADGLKTFCGTPAYFAPEVLQRRGTVAGVGRYGKPADCWSLGVILYILLTGRPPFDADMDEPKTLELDFDSDPLWASFPLAQELVQQMLRPDPKRRLTVGQACDHPWINIDDGDTHCHPLDDPAVTTKKRLFPTEGRRTDERSMTLRKGHDNDTSSLCSLDDSVRSKDDSVLSKEEFAHAAVSHIRNDSVFHVDMTTLPNILSTIPSKQSRNIVEEGEASEPREGDRSSLDQIMKLVSSTGKQQQGDTDVEAPMPSIPSVDERQNSSSPRDVMEHMSIDSYGNPALDASVTTDAFQGTSPIAALGPAGTVSDVTPYERSLSPPRSPLAKLNLNERSNRFRSQVLEQSKCHMKSPSMEHTSLYESSGRGKDACQSAVTPTSSNVSKQTQQQQQRDSMGIDESPHTEDPILSQFSSEPPSSVDSFGDNSTSSYSKGRQNCNERSSVDLDLVSSNSSKVETGEKKRRLDDDTAGANDSSKRARVGKEVKQTTLKSWLRKKGD